MEKDFEDFTQQRGNMKLSPREIQILEFLSYGYVDKEIAQKLDISYRTVQTHISRIVMKLNARNRTAAVADYIRKYELQFA